MMPRSAPRPLSDAKWSPAHLLGDKVKRQSLSLLTNTSIFHTMRYDALPSLSCRHPWCVRYYFRDRSRREWNIMRWTIQSSRCDELPIMTNNLLHFQLAVICDITSLLHICSHSQVEEASAGQVESGGRRDLGDGGAEVGWDNKVAPGIQYSLEEALPLERLRLRTFKVQRSSSG